MGEVEAEAARRWTGRIARSDLPGPPRGQGRGGERAQDPSARLLPVLPAPGAPNRSAPRPLDAPSGAGRVERREPRAEAEGDAGAGAGSAAWSPHRARPAAFLSSPRRCRELSLRPWRAWAPWTLRAATRWCARCATHSSSARACWTASTTSAPAACAAAPPMAASPARCASECLQAPTDTRRARGGWLRVGGELDVGKARLWLRRTEPAPLRTAVRRLPPIIQSRLTEA